MAWALAIPAASVISRVGGSVTSAPPIASALAIPVPVMVWPVNRALTAASENSTHGLRVVSAVSSVGDPTPDSRSVVLVPPYRIVTEYDVFTVLVARYPTSSARRSPSCAAIGVMEPEGTEVIALL